MKRTIVCGIDFSPQAGEAARLAGRLAQRLHGELLLVHVYEPVVLLVPEAPAAAMAIDEARRAAAHNKLRQATAALVREGFLARDELRTGAAHQELLRAAEAARAHLLVVGTHGRGGLSRAMLGSVAERVADHASLPVLVVPSGAGPGSRPRWLEEARPSRLLLGVDDSQTTTAAISFARGLVEELESDVVAAHVFWPPIERARRGLPWTLESESEDPEVSGSLARQVKELLAPWPGGRKLEVLVRARWGSEGEALARLAGDVAADVVVVGTHQRHGLKRWLRGSVSREVLRHTSLPVLFVPGGMRPQALLGVPPIRHVLVAADTSPAGALAVARAVSLLPSGGVLELAFVGRRGSSPEELSRHGEELVPASAREAHLEIHVHVVLDDAAAELSHMAVRLGVDTAVVPAPRRGAYEEPSSGRVVDELLAVGCSVVVVPEPPR